MPSDPIFTDPDDTPQASDSEPEKKGTPASPDSGALTEDTVRSLISDAVGGVDSKVDKLVAVFESLSEQAQAQRAQQSRQAEPAVEPSDLANELFTDPKTVFEREVGAAAAPLIQKTAAASVQNYIRDARSEIEDEFGTEAWTEVFEKPINRAVQEKLQTDPQVLLDRVSIDNAVATLRGSKANFDRLMEMRTTHAEARTKADTEREETLVKRVTDNVVPLTGGIRRSSGPDGRAQLDDEHKSVIAAMEKGTGSKVDADRLAALLPAIRANGGSLNREQFEATIGKKAAS